MKKVREIRLKTPEEIEKIAISGQLVARFLDDLVTPLLKPGVRTIDIDSVATEFAYSNNAIPTFTQVPNYYHSTCISINEQVVHGIPSDRKLADGDVVKIDFGITKDGFIGDACRTYMIGEAPKKSRELVEVTKQSLFLGIEAAVIGKRIGDIGYAIQKYCEHFGFGVVREFVGHGVGIELHELPSIPHFGHKGTGIVLKEGMVLAIEPMINIGTWRTKILADGWTAITMDGKHSAQFEHTIAITKNGPRILTKI